MDALQAIGEPELRDALLLVRGRQRPVSADELAAAQGVHRNVARSRLARLVEAGLLFSRFERRTGRTGPGAGRPAKVYAPTPETTAIEFPPRHYEELVALLAASLPERGRAKRLRQIGSALAARLLADNRPSVGSDLRRGLDNVCEMLGRLGFHARVESVGEDTAVIATATCPLRPLVSTTAQAIHIDHGLWCALVESAVSGLDRRDLHCETHDCLDTNADCRIVLKLGRQRA
jgi:predicted ArsR family transcriptional regulator